MAAILADEDPTMQVATGIAWVEEWRIVYAATLLQRCARILFHFS